MNTPPIRRAEFTQAQLQLLLSPLDPRRVSNRTQGGSKLSYVEAHDIKAMLIRMFGFANFSSEVSDARILKLEEIQVPEFEWNGSKKGAQKTNADGSPKFKTQWRAVAQATITLTIHQSGARYTETAVSSQNGIDPGEVADFAIKTAESDAFKRCAIFLGTQFGLSLYKDGTTNDTVEALFDPYQQSILYQPQPQAPVSGPNTPGVGADTQQASNAPTAPAHGATDEALARMQGALSQGPKE